MDNDISGNAKMSMGTAVGYSDTGPSLDNGVQVMGQAAGYDGNPVMLLNPVPDPDVIPAGDWDIYTLSGTSNWEKGVAGDPLPGVSFNLVNVGATGLP